MVRKFYRLNQLNSEPAVVILLGLALLARLIRLTAFDLWYDEAYIAYTALMDFRLIATGEVLDIYPPLYFVIVHLLFQGQFSLALFRGLSVFCSLASLFMIYLTVRHALGLNLALTSVLLLVIHPFQVYYAREGKVYAFLTFLVFSYLYLLRKVIENPANKVGWLGFVLVYASIIYTHYHAVAVLVAGFVYVILDRTIPAKARRGFLLSTALVAVTFIPWVVVLLEKLTRTFNSKNITYIPELSIKRLVSLGYTFTAGYNSPPIVGGLATILSLLLVAKGIYSLRARRELLWFFLAFLLIPPLFILLLSIPLPMFMERHVIYSAGIYFILVALGVASFSSCLVRAGIITLVLAAQGLALCNIYLNKMPVQEQAVTRFFPATPRRPFRQVSEYINVQYRPGDVVLHFIPQSYLPCKFYLDQGIPANVVTLHPEAFAYQGYADLAKLFGEFPVNLWQLYERYERFWFVESYWGVAKDKEIPAVELNQWLAARCLLKAEYQLIDVTVRLYQKSDFFTGVDHTIVLADNGLTKTVLTSETQVGPHIAPRIRTQTTTKPRQMENLLSLELTSYLPERVDLQITNLSQEIRECRLMTYQLQGVLEAERMNSYPLKVQPWWLPVWNEDSLPWWREAVLITQEAQKAKTEPRSHLDYDLDLPPGRYALFARLPLWPVADTARGQLEFSLNGLVFAVLTPLGYGPAPAIELKYLGVLNLTQGPNTLTVNTRIPDNRTVAWVDLDRFYFVEVTDVQLMEAESLAQSGDGIPWVPSRETLEQPSSGGMVAKVAVPAGGRSRSLTAEFQATSWDYEVWVRIPGSTAFTPGARAKIEATIGTGMSIVIPPALSRGVHESGFIRLGRLQDGPTTLTLTAFNDSPEPLATAEVDLLVFRPACEGQSSAQDLLNAPCFALTDAATLLIREAEQLRTAVQTCWNPEQQVQAKDNNLVRVELEDTSTKLLYFVQSVRK